jgi:hypothetical protein
MGIPGPQMFRRRRRVSREQLRRFQGRFWLLLLIISLVMGALCAIEIAFIGSR